MMDHHTTTPKFPALSVFDSGPDTSTQASMWISYGSSRALAQELTSITHVVALIRGMAYISRDSVDHHVHQLSKGQLTSTLFLVLHWQMLSSRVWQVTKFLADGPPRMTADL